HGRSPVLDASRVEPLPLLGSGRDRDDEPDGGAPRPRGRDVLRVPGAGHRLRLLAGGGGGRGGRGGAGGAGRERGPRPADEAGGRGRGGGAGGAGPPRPATVPAGTPCASRS